MRKGGDGSCDVTGRRPEAPEGQASQFPMWSGREDKWAEVKIASS